MEQQEQEPFNREQFHQWKQHPVSRAMRQWLEVSLDNHCRAMGLGEFLSNDVAQHVHVGRNQMMAALLALTFEELIGIEEGAYEGESIKD